MSRAYTTEGAAGRYDAARELPPQTNALWMATLAELLPANFVPQAVLDLGAGTGRFAGLLHQAFGCPVEAVEPSAAMLREGQDKAQTGLRWQQGAAEAIPLAAAAVDLVWMSQAFHHLENPAAAFGEIRRVLRPGGCFVVRNGTQENNAEVDWPRFFPAAAKLDEGRMPTQQGLVEQVCGHGFEQVAMQTVYQYFAASYSEYYDKISGRGLSALISISDRDFAAGVEAMRAWVEKQPADRPVYEPVDVFVFRLAAIDQA